jgi:hypothetical protein
MSEELDNTLAIRFTKSELLMLRFALWRFMNDANDKHASACLKGSKATPEEGRRLYQDAKDAEALLARLRQVDPHL